MWNNFLDRQSYIELKPKVAEAAATKSGGLSTAVWVVIGVVVLLGGSFVVVLLKQRERGRAVEE